MPLIFPTSASIDQLYQSGSSATYKWNGSFWQIAAPAQTGLSVLTASYSERVAWVQETPPPTSTGSMWYDIDTGNTYIKYDSAWVPVQSNTVNATSASFATTALTSSKTTTTSDWMDVLAGGGMWISSFSATVNKATTKLVDYQKYRQIGPKTYEMVMHYAHNNNTGTSAGSGLYLFPLPNVPGFQFDTTLYGTDPHTNSLGIESATSARAVIQGSNGYISNGSQNLTAIAKVWDATRFVIVSQKSISGGASENNQLRDSYFQLNGGTIVYTMRFTFQIA